MLRRANKKQPQNKHGSRSVTDSKSQLNETALGETKPQDELDHTLERAVLGDDQELIHSLEATNAKKVKKARKLPEEHKPAWEDEDDDQVTVSTNKRVRYLKEQKEINANSTDVISGEKYKHQLKNEFQKVSGNAEWAKLKWERDDDSDAEDSGDEGTTLLRSTGNYLDSAPALPQSVIQLSRCTDANSEGPSQANVRAVEFHPSAQVILAAGLDQRLSLFQVDGKSNPKIQSIYVEQFPIHTAHFTRDGREVIMASKCRKFYYYDMMAGKVVLVPRTKGIEDPHLSSFEMSPDGQLMVFYGRFGRMYLFSTKTKEFVDTLTMNGSLAAVAFSPDGSTMYSHGDDGEVYVWDMLRRSCVHRFRDQGCVMGTALAASPNGQYLAAGSRSGVVNIYDVRSAMASRQPEPLKAVMNLTLPCTHLKFNPTTEILALSSTQDAAAAKLVHFPSMTTFQNFPERGDGLKTVWSLDFSLRSGYFAVGNSSGRALLYRVKHYKDF